MSNDKNMFIFINSVKSDILVAKKSEKMISEGKGRIQSEKIILNNVNYVPDLSKNLLSVNAITEKGGEVKFTKDSVYVMKNNCEILSGKKQENGLYVINIEKSEQECMLTESNARAEKCHRKLGHLSVTNMKKLIEISTGLNITKNDCDHIEKTCETCLQAKQTRFPFITTRNRASRPLEILHSDLCGPIDPVTWDNKKYFLTVLDDFTHHTAVLFIRKKHEVSEYLRNYIKEAESHHNQRVSKLRCDNGGEFVNYEFKDWCKNKGIVIDRTIPHTPQLNGKAERLNRTIMEKGRALIFDSKLKKEFWGEAVRVAVYLLNRSLVDSCLQDKTPSENWSGKKPDLSRLQLFGSEA